jgi:hypothetical protein
MSFDGVDDYFDADDFSFGGDASFAAYFQQDTLTGMGPVLDFGDGQNDDNVVVTG